MELKRDIENILPYKNDDAFQKEGGVPLFGVHCQTCLFSVPMLDPYPMKSEIEV